MTDPQIKLFLSVDIAGSTQLKNSNSYYRIQQFCDETLKIVNELKTQNTKQYELRDIYSQICKEDDYQDWSEIIKKCFGAFNAEFVKQRGFKEIYPWKMAGDELIYCIPVNTRKEVHLEVVAFFRALRIHDKKYAEKNSLIRLKGSAWTAGFPIRNRIMFPLDYDNKNGCKKSEKCPYIFNREDYMGTEIDIGFRIGKYTYPGMIVVSIELACILLDYHLTISDEERFIVIDTGWEKLKGVWEEHKYPIYWLEFQDNLITDDIDYEKYKDWDKEENDHVKTFASSTEGNNKKNVSFKDIRNIIKQLPKEFDVGIPYFVNDGDDKPDSHIKRADFISMVEDVLNAQTAQNVTYRNKIDNDEKKIKDRLSLIEKKTMLTS